MSLIFKVNKKKNVITARLPLRLLRMEYIERIDADKKYHNSFVQKLLVSEFTEARNGICYALIYDSQ